ncbi:MAG: RecX family transcriptional regulator [Sphingomonadaceae bacterium]|nr:RecX family transcriptional regulator [Sphingomonadaceae bacterium]NBU78160.1 RecX family transcriptional regulator [Sphingomonadaceae bacterium]NCA01162.1 RecX family transcriptional regulator [Sphingomonadaceae bacterium]
MKRMIGRKPLNTADLRQMALTYVGRFATSQSKLASYLTRKIRERGWEDTVPPDRAVAHVVENMAQARFVDDRAYAEMKAQGLVRRGYGARRVRQALDSAGIAPDIRADLEAMSPEEAEAAALAYAQRRRLGPFSRQSQDQRQRERALAALLRAGHDYATARRILDLAPELGHNS